LRRRGDGAARLAPVLITPAIPMSASEGIVTSRGRAASVANDPERKSLAIVLSSEMAMPAMAKR
jgi:hypothetical protein